MSIRTHYLYGHDWHVYFDIRASSRSVAKLRESFQIRIQQPGYHPLSQKRKLLRNYVNLAVQQTSAQETGLLLFSQQTNVAADSILGPQY